MLVVFKYVSLSRIGYKVIPELRLIFGLNYTAHLKTKVKVLFCLN